MRLGVQRFTLSTLLTASFLFGCGNHRSPTEPGSMSGARYEANLPETVPGILRTLTLNISESAESPSQLTLEKSQSGQVLQRIEFEIILTVDGEKVSGVWPELGCESRLDLLASNRWRILTGTVSWGAPLDPGPGCSSNPEPVMFSRK